MDAPREIVVARVGDPWLERGFAVLAVDGPGQGEAAISGVHVTDTNWIEAGEALGPSWRGLAVDWLHDRVLGRPAADEHRLVTPAGQLVELPPLR